MRCHLGSQVGEHAEGRAPGLREVDHGRGGEEMEYRDMETVIEAEKREATAEMRGLHLPGTGPESELPEGAAQGLGARG